MNEIADLVARKAGIDAGLAAKSAGIMLALVKSDGDPALVAELMDKLPHAEELAAAEKGSGGGFLARLGGGALAAYGKLTAAGLDGDQIRAVAEALFEHARQHTGDDLVARVVKSVPGLSRFV
jgi:hypothetical protein